MRLSDPVLLLDRLGVNHYPHHIGDFNNATRHLSRVERSIYRDLMDLYYDTEAPLRDDEAWLMKRILCLSEDAAEFRAVLREFFVLRMTAGTTAVAIGNWWPTER